jgi:pimeloyl-ACP methyl ester carboxylesterase
VIRRAAAVAALAALALAALAALAAGARGGVPAPRPLAAACGASDVRARPFWLTTSDGVRLYAAEAGAGPTTVVLAHESPADLCGWLPFVPYLTRAGFRVLLFDFRGFGESERSARIADALAVDRDLRAAVARARADGAKRVFLVGASFGGAAALAVAPSLAVDGVVSLSGEARLPDWRLDGAAAVRRLHVPLLVVGSRADRYLSVADALLLVRRAAVRDKRAALFPGGFHGWDLVEDAPYAAKVRALVVGWIARRA